MAVVKPFRALRYDERRAGPLRALVAQPYDVIGPEQRERYLEASPYNVVRLTLADDPDEAAAMLGEWRREGVLAEDDEPALWRLSQDYVGPDGVARTRDGVVVSLRAEPYEERVVLPHERTHAGPKEGRLRLLRATRTQLEPIFLLADAALDPAVEGPPELEVEEGGVTSRLWRLTGGAAERVVEELRDARLLIADGHHRYETALAFHREDGSPESAFLLAVVVPTGQPGLTIFPTHRVARAVGASLDGTPAGDPLAALQRVNTLTQGRAAAVVYTREGARLVEGEERELDVALVERFAPEGVTYTPRAEEAVAAVDAGEAEAAFLLRPPTIEQVRAVAEAGETMPQKSTYFYPKLHSGLLFHPL